MDEYEFLEEFAENLNDLMREQGLTQSGLANVSGLSVKTVNRYLKAKSMPSAKALVNLSYVLNCDIEDLIPTYKLIND